MKMSHYNRREKMYRKLLVFLLALSLVFVLVACGDSGTTTEQAVVEDGATETEAASDATEPTADGEETYTIALHYEQTGEVADYGNAELKGSRLAIKLANEAAGYEKFLAKEYDNKSDSAEAVTIANVIAGEDAVGVIGPSTSGASAASYQVLDDAGKVVISPSATQNNITLKADGQPYANVFRVCFEDSYQGAGMAQYAVDVLGDDKVVILTDSASDYAKGLEEAFDAQFTKLGGEIVAKEYYVAGDTDFSSVLTNIAGQDFDSLYIAGYYNEAGLIIKQAREAGIDAVILGADGFDSESLIELAGAANLNDVKFTTAYTTVDASDKLQAFIDAYEAEYNEAPAMFAALAFDSTNLLIDAINEGKDVANLSETIAAMTFDGVTGEFTFDETHSPIKDVIVVDLVDGVQSGAETISPAN